MKPLYTALSATLLALGAYSASAADAPRPVVLELFTSQGCSSCPPADELLRELAKDPTNLALAYHVDYWDYIGWKDPFSLKDSTNRQYGYAAIQGKSTSYTPQLMVDGLKSVIGSRTDEVKDAIAAAHKTGVSVPVTITPGKELTIHIAAADKPTAAANVYAVRFKHAAMTEVKAGENKGRSLASINSVTSIQDIGAWTQKAQDFTVPANSAADIGIAILLQQPSDGRILGAASYIGQ